MSGWLIAGGYVVVVASAGWWGLGFAVVHAALLLLAGRLRR